MHYSRLIRLKIVCAAVCAPVISSTEACSSQVNSPAHPAKVRVGNPLPAPPNDVQDPVQRLGPPRVPCADVCPGTCIDERCLEIIASGRHAPREIIATPGGVYWCEFEAIMFLDGPGRAPHTLAWEKGVMMPSGIAADRSRVYWSWGGANGAVMKAGLLGGVPTRLASGQVDPAGVAVDGTNVYWAAVGTGDSGGTIMKVPIAGGRPVVLAAGEHRPASIAVDGTSVYWINYTDAAGSENGAVMRASIAGGPAMVLVPPDRPHGGGIAVDATSVYYSTARPEDGQGGPGEVVKVPVGGGSPVVLATDLWSSNGLVIDSTDVYWCESNVIMKVPKSGGTSTRLFSGSTDIGGIAVDATSIYWTDFWQGNVTKLTPR